MSDLLEVTDLISTFVIAGGPNLAAVRYTVRTDACTPGAEF